MLYVGSQSSQKYQLSKEDLEKIGKGLLIAIAGTALTYTTAIIANIDIGVWTPLIVSAWSVFVNIANKYLKENNKYAELQ